MNIIGHISTDFPTKFGIPRQSGLIEELKGVITFEPEYRQPEAFRGLEDFSHIWVLWQFSKSQKKTIASTVTPPRLGGKVRMGVFATRSPFRPNDIGMILSILVDTFISKISFPMQPGPEIGSISDA